MNDIFTSWLASGDIEQCCFQEQGSIYIVIRVEKSSDFEYLFCCKHSSKEGISKADSFQYAGIYCRKDGLLYDAQKIFIKVAEKPVVLQTRTAGVLREQLRAAVCKIVETALDNDPNNLQITELTNRDFLERLKDIKQSNAKSAARKHFLDTVEFEPPVFRCLYEPETWTEDALLSYILDPDGYADTEAADYMTANQQEMLLEFLYNAAVIREYESIVEDTENPVHIVKKIMEAMRTTSAKTVIVTVRKEGVEFTFKMEAAELRRDCTSNYHAWNIVAADRREFAAMFGKHTDFYPQEIIRITYARNVLYEAEG